MKKLMIAAAIVCAAAFAQASTAYWNFKSAATVDGVVYNSESDTKANGTIYFYQLTDAFSQENVLTYYRENASFISGYAASGDLVNGAFALSGVQTETEDSTGAFFAAYFDGKNLLLSDEIEDNISTQPSGTTLVYELAWLGEDPVWDGTVADRLADTDYEVAEGYYSVASVPEPTSGLLLLLGVAGLALRRRRA